MTEVRASQYWDVKMSPPKNLTGNLMKKVGGSIGRMNFLNRSRQISVEIHGPLSFDTASVSPTVMKGLLKGQTSRALVGIGANQLADDDEIVIRVLKPAKEADDEDDHNDGAKQSDEASVSTLGLGGADEVRLLSCVVPIWVSLFVVIVSINAVDTNTNQTQSSCWRVDVATCHATS